MNKRAFQSKWYYRLLQVVFWASLIFIVSGLLILSAFEDDIPMAGVFWAIAVILVYWLIKKVFYRVMFGERILGREKD